jgi:RHS repeat-associated protein
VYSQSPGGVRGQQFWYDDKDSTALISNYHSIDLLKMGQEARDSILNIPVSSSLFFVLKGNFAVPMEDTLLQIGDVTLVDVGLYHGGGFTSIPFNDSTSKIVSVQTIRGYRMAKDTAPEVNIGDLSIASPYRFNSKEKDQETGLHYYGARYYSSKLSVWMSVDPLAHKTLQPYIFTSNNTLLFIDPDGRENIVIIGNQGSRPNSDANSGSDKKHFLEAGLKEAFELNKQNEQNTTILITKGDYTEEQLFSITERANVYGINVLIIEGGAGDVIDYINNGANQNRNQDLITDLVYVGHSTDDNLYIGQGVGLDRALSSDRITREIKSEAFYTESTVKLNSCRAGNCSIVPNSIATAFASKVSKVFATPNYVNWSLPVGTYDTNLPNNQWQTTEGTGGVVGSVLKQKVELKSKSIKL